MKREKKMFTLQKNRKSGNIKIAKKKLKIVNSPGYTSWQRDL